MKKAQIAMETILIYGASILVVTLAIGALIYFGVLDLGGLLPDKCDTGNTILCENFQVKTDGTMQLEFRNRAGKIIEITNVNVSGIEDWTGVVNCDDPASKTVVNGALQLVDLDTCGLGSTHLDQKIRASIAIDYKVGGSAITQQARGELQATVGE